MPAPIDEIVKRRVIQQWRALNTKEKEIFIDDVFNRLLISKKTC
jgi:hypothetical protein